MSAALPGPGIDLEVCLAVGRPENAGVWDTGRWDAAVWADTDTDLGDWVDVTCDVEVPFTMHAGTDSGDGVVTRWEAATVAFTLWGDLYNPRAMPWAGLLGPGLPVRIRWRPTGTTDWLPGFAGYVDDDGFKWSKQPGRAGRAAIAATDATRIFNAADLMPRADAVDGETAAARVHRIADAIDWPPDLRRITAGGVPVRATDLSGNAWSQLLLTADTDLAHLWIDAAGYLTYVPQGRVHPDRTPLIQITCDPDGSGVPAAPPVSVTGQQPTVVRNVANIQRSVASGAPEAPVVTLEDDGSIARYLRHVYSRSDLLNVTDSVSLLIAQAVLTSAAWPSVAPAAVELTSRASLDAGYFMMGLDPDLTMSVQDAYGTVWLCQAAGWSVQVDRDAITGTIALIDVTSYVGDQWDTAAWDQSKWSYS